MTTQRKKERELPGDDEISCSSLFLDSGAFTMRQQSWKFEKESGKSWRDFYDTTEFWDYANAYAAFVKRNEHRLDLYANLDVIPDPELSWRNQQYLESKGIKPVPVVHLGTSMKWVKHYIDRGYPLLGLGGLVASGGFGSQRGINRWLDEVFDLICDTPDHTPCIKTHGFGLMGPVTYRYPFYSVDSTAWVMKGSFGWVLVPKKRNGHFVFGEDWPHLRSDMPYSVAVTDPSMMPEGTVPGRMDDHFLSLGKTERKLVLEWLELIQVPFGNINTKGEIVEEGVSNNRRMRILAGLRFYEEMLKRYKPYPWPFSVTRRPSLGLL